MNTIYPSFFRQFYLVCLLTRRSICLLFFVLFFTVSGAVAQRQTSNSFRSKFGPNAYVGYLAYTPKDYAANPTKKYPLLLFLHGLGEKAWMAEDSSKLFLVKKHGPPKLIEQGMDFPFIVISPQCPFDDWENVTMDNYKTSVYKPSQFVDEVLEKMKNLYRVDLSRVYISGLSMGSAATWSYIMHHPEKIAAAIPVAGWIDDPSLACEIASNNVGLWAFQGELDEGASIRDFVEGVNACKPAPVEKAKATIYAGKHHDVWTQTYNNTGPGIAPDNIYKWLMRHSKSKITTETKTGEISLNETLKVYPVPAKNKLIISYPAEKEVELQVQIVDAIGREVLNKTITGLINKEIELDLAGLENGVYVLSIMGEGRRETCKVVVEQ